MERLIQFKCLTSHDRKQRDVTVEEKLRNALFQTKIVRRCTYAVSRQVSVSSYDDCAIWAKTTFNTTTPRQVFVTKKIHPATGAEDIVYKVLGHFYSVLDKTIYKVQYRHLLSMRIMV